MLPTKADVTLSGNLVGQEIKMGIDTKSLAFLQTILTDLYSDPKLAVIREYSTNAWDAQVEAGVTSPIEVTTPNSLSPYFTVKDSGIGLSVEDIRTIYSQYGASTKRMTNTQTGMLGLGCKSALTYTNQFTITAVKDGIKTAVIVSRDEDNVGAMTVVASTKVDEPNGVKISVPINRGDQNEFTNKAKEFFSFWKPGTVLLNGKEPELVEGNYISEKILIRSNLDYNSRGKHKLVMGNVSYNLSHDELYGGDRYSNSRVDINITYDSAIVFFVDMGEVDFTPSREELHYTAKTKSLLRKLVENFNNDLSIAIIKDIQGQPTHADAVARFFSWDSQVNSMPDPITFQGDTMPLNLNFDEFYRISSWSNNMHERKIKRVKLKSIILDDTAFIVTGKPTDQDITTGQKAKLRVWANDTQGVSNPEFYFAEKDEYTPWTNSIKHVKWQVILDTKIKRQKIESQKNKYYRLGQYGQEDIDAANISSNSTLLWANIGDIPKDRMYSVWQWAHRHDCEIIIVAKNKQKSFFANFPAARVYTDWARDKIKKYNDGLTADQKEIIGFMEHQSFNSMTFFDNPRVEDPELRRIAGIAKLIRIDASINTSDVAKLKREFHEYRAMERSLTSDHTQWVIMDPTNPAEIVDKYKLLGYIGRNYHHELLEDLIIYINAAYQKETNAVYTV
jgi:hypothetical protein